MKRKKAKQKFKLSKENPNVNLLYRMQLTSFAEKIVTDATNKGIKCIHISSGRVKILSETIERDKIIVKVPSREQSIFLRNYINKASSNGNPFHVVITNSTELKFTGSNDGGGTGNKRGIYPTERIAGSSASGNGTGGRRGINPAGRIAGSSASGNGTRGRHGINLTEYIAGSSTSGNGTGRRRGINPAGHVDGSSAGGDGTGGRHGITIRGPKGGDGTGRRRGKTPPRTKF